MLSHRSVGDEKCFPISIQICTKVGELFSVWTEVQRDFSAHIKEFQHQFDMILEGAKQLDLAKVFLKAIFCMCTFCKHFFVPRLSCSRQSRKKES